MLGRTRTHSVRRMAVAFQAKQKIQANTQPFDFNGTFDAEKFLTRDATKRIVYRNFSEVENCGHGKKPSETIDDTFVYFWHIVSFSQKKKKKKSTTTSETKFMSLRHKWSI